MQRALESHRIYCSSTQSMQSSSIFIREIYYDYQIQRDLTLVAEVNDFE